MKKKSFNIFYTILFFLVCALFPQQSNAQKLWGLSTKQAIFTKDGKKIITSDFEAGVYDISHSFDIFAKKNEVYSVEKYFNASAIASSIDGKYMAFASTYSKIFLVERQKKVFKLNKDERYSYNAVVALAFSHNNKFLLGALEGNGLVMWNLDSLEKVKYLPQDKGIFSNSVCFSPDGSYAISGNSDGSLVLYDVENLTELRRYSCSFGHKKAIKSVIFSQDGKYIFSGGEDNQVLMWDTETGNLVKRFEVYTSVLSLALTFDDGYIFIGCASHEQNLQIWNVQTGQMRWYYTDNKDSYADKNVSYLSLNPTNGWQMLISFERIIRDHPVLRDMQVWELKYEEDIAKEKKNSKLFGSKDEFESESDYEKRVAKSVAFEIALTEKYRKKYETYINSVIAQNNANANNVELAKLRKKQAERERIAQEERERKEALARKIKDSYKSVCFKVDAISVYNPEKQTFDITSVGKTLTLNIPREEAKALKENMASAKVCGVERLKEDGETKEVINLQLLHPTLDKKYAFGAQVEIPVYVSEPNIVKETPKKEQPKEKEPTKPTENPDRDNDGVPNAQDACPDKAGEKAQKGCPDTDQDGIYDHEDRCPEVAGVLSKQGCPIDQNQDSDKDGVPDSKDRCPFQKGTIANNGCPETEKDVTPPTIAFPNLPTSSPSKAYLLAGKAEDSNGIKSIRINGKEIPFFPDGRFEQEVELKEGQNTFTVQASDLAGNASEKRVNLAYRFAGKFPLPKRLALLVGNSAYKFAEPLEKCQADVQATSEALKKLGFEVITAYDLDKEALDSKVYQFTERLKNEKIEVGLFYYAGHGAQVELKEQKKIANYLVPIDAKIQSPAKECIDAQFVVNDMANDFTKVKIVILDACRDNLYDKNRGKKNAINSLSAVEGMLISYATEAGEWALEDGDGKNSRYTTALLKYINIPNRSLGQIMQDITKEVSEKTEKSQVPGFYNKLTNDFYFVIEE